MTGYDLWINTNHNKIIMFHLQLWLHGHENYIIIKKIVNYGLERNFIPSV